LLWKRLDVYFHTARSLNTILAEGESMMSTLHLKHAYPFMTATVFSFFLGHSALGQDGARAFNYEAATKLQHSLATNAASLDKAIKSNQPSEIDKAVTSAEGALQEYQAPTVEDINGLVTALSSSLTAYSGDRSALEPNLLLLEDAIASGNGTRTAAFIGPRADKLREWIANSDWQQGVPMKPLADLSEQLFKAMRTNEPTAATAALGKAADLVTGKSNDGYRLPTEIPAVQNQLVAARTTLDDKVRAIDPYVWLAGVAVAADSLLVGKSDDKDDVKLNRAATINRLQNIPEAMAAAVKIKAAMEKLGDGFRPMLHIIQAYYGDVYQGQNPRRNCDATEAMIARCEREKSCTLSDDYKTSLCGFDPIPAADDRTRGVVVTFSCQVGGDTTWDTLARYRGLDPDTGSDLKDPKNPARRYALMRGTKMEIRCPTDAPEAK
jgi:hypothetical protein